MPHAMKLPGFCDESLWPYITSRATAASIRDAMAGAMIGYEWLEVCAQLAEAMRRPLNAADMGNAIEALQRASQPINEATLETMGDAMRRAARAGRRRRQRELEAVKRFILDGGALTFGRRWPW